MQKWREWSTASDADWDKALQREAVIRPLAEQARLGEREVTDAASRLQLGRVTTYRLVRRYRNSATNFFPDALEARACSEHASYW
jgi:hypothetical protein